MACLFLIQFLHSCLLEINIYGLQSLVEPDLIYH
jgi:hypothetical protein